MVKQNERASYISLTSAVAADYFNLIKFDKLIKDQEELVKLQTEIVRLEEIKYKNGLCPVTELMDEKQLLTQLREELNVYVDKRLIVARELGVLTGLREKDLSVMPRSDYSVASLLPLPQSINAEVIQYRPDYLKAEDYIEKSVLMQKLPDAISFLNLFYMVRQVSVRIILQIFSEITLSNL